MRPIRIAAALGVAALVSIVPLSAAMAADATGCSGTVDSFSATGEPLGTASAPGEGGTMDAPLPIDTSGTVAWKGSTDTVITNGTWSVSAMGATVMSGSFDNAEGATTSTGRKDLAELPQQLAWALQGQMVIPVSGSITGTGGSCTAEGYITGTGSATSSPMFYAGAGLAVVGVALAGGVIAGTKAAAGAAAAGAAGGTVT
jgi:hypothetical protein